MLPLRFCLECEPPLIDEAKQMALSFPLLPSTQSAWERLLLITLENCSVKAPSKSIIDSLLPRTHNKSHEDTTLNQEQAKLDCHQSHMEDEHVGGSEAMLDRVIEVLSPLPFGIYCNVIVAVARKVDEVYLPLLFPKAGEPHFLFRYSAFNQDLYSKNFF